MELSKEVAIRPHSPEYSSLVMDVNHAFQTILSPAKMNALYLKLEDTYSQLEKRVGNFTTNSSLQEATLCATSIENFISILNQYRYIYPDIIEPLYCNIMELLYGIKMKISVLQKFMCEENFTKSYKINVQAKLVNLANNGTK
ncbi:hypothetical protein AMK59_8477 [Oryctes borbonicus]|uniref:Uncharacterized protein n=1 Tax=Oryctes borbonicus TaxID=1629725 RepID=A0A0T6AXB2_9SCAR|nr:hypothetical protein AMK59_8477 [Oryctes borbonicus]